MMPGMMRPPIMHGMRPAPNASVHQTGLTPSLLRLFVARPPVEYHPPPAKPKKTQPYTGIADYVKLFTDPEEDPPPPPAEPKETKAEKKTRRAAEKAKENDARIEEDITSWNPKEDPKLADSDPYKTLFVGRLSYDVDEAALRREFERFGAVKSVTVVEDQDGKPRGYAFVEFDRESDMKHAYRSADGLRLEGRRILVDAERGRTVPDWRPRRFNGGLGGTRRGGKTENSLVAGRDQAYHNRAQEAGGGGGGGYAGHGYGGGPQQQGHGHGQFGDDRRDSRRGSSRDSRRDDRDRGRDRNSSRYDRRDDRSRDRRDDRRDEGIAAGTGTTTGIDATGTGTGIDATGTGTGIDATGTGTGPGAGTGTTTATGGTNATGPRPGAGGTTGTAIASATTGTTARTRRLRPTAPPPRTTTKIRRTESSE